MGWQLGVQAAVCSLLVTAAAGFSTLQGEENRQGWGADAATGVSSLRHTCTAAGSSMRAAGSRQVLPAAFNRAAPLPQDGITSELTFFP